MGEQYKSLDLTRVRNSVLLTSMKEVSFKVCRSEPSDLYALAMIDSIWADQVKLLEKNYTKVTVLFDQC